jgi:pimeloyl-ACP methyl ester carboxylesterase
MALEEQGTQALFRGQELQPSQGRAEYASMEPVRHRALCTGYPPVMRNIMLLLLTACARTPAPVEPVAETLTEAPTAETGTEIVAPEPSPAIGERLLIPSTSRDLTPEGFEQPATVVLPEGEPGSAPCVVFIAGSGPTNRDWISAMLPGTNGSARQLAEELLVEGVGSIRYDKAAIGESTWPVPDTTLDLYRDEARLAWRHLTDQSVCGQVSFVGNSEGSIHSFRAGLQLQDEPRFGGVVSLSGPAISILATVKIQLEAQLPEGTDMDAVDVQLDDLETRIRRLPEMDGPPMLSLIPGAGGIWMSAVNPVQGELVTDLLLVEPMEAIGLYTGPALVMAADNDVQVPPSEAEAIFAGLAPSDGPRLHVLVENGNHVYKHEIRGREDMELVLAYFQEGVPLAEGVVTQIRDFLFALEGGTESP